MCVKQVKESFPIFLPGVEDVQRVIGMVERIHQNQDIDVGFSVAA